MAGLSGADIAVIRSTWAKVQGSGSATDIGRSIFIKFFELDPAAQNEFPCKGESLAALKTNVLLGQHGAKFMEYITTAVNGLDDYAGKAHGPLTELGSRHKTRGTTPANFGKAGEALLAILASVVGGDFTPAAKDAWTKVYNTISSTMQAAL
uniref:Nerve myoglobin n=1 Tax=Aphrodita aculeata TaxID=45666 RepID=Q93101_9ANNE|nr:nerve myoglobin [Aphrodita aculeata]